MALPGKKDYLMMKSAQFNPSSWVFQLVEFELNLGRFENELDMMSDNTPIERNRSMSIVSCPLSVASGIRIWFHIL